MLFYDQVKLIKGLVEIGLALLVLYWTYKSYNTSIGELSEKRTKAFRNGIIGVASLCLLGLLDIYKATIGYQLSADKIVQAARSQYQLPMIIDEGSRWDAIDSREHELIYTWTITKTFADLTEREEFVESYHRQISLTVCENPLIQEAQKHGISFRFIFRFAEASFPEVTKYPENCRSLSK
jgi:hypothetical protein